MAITEARAREESGMPQEGVRIRFANPGELRVFILAAERFQSGATIPEIMSGIRAVPLGEMPLDGDLFKSATFTLVIEPDPVKGGQRQRAIIRTDIQLGERKSALASAQINKRTNEEGFTDISEYSSSLSHAFYERHGEQLSFHPWGGSVSRIHGALPTEDEQRAPVAILQLLDKDIGPGSILLSLFSYGRYVRDLKRRLAELRQGENAGSQADASGTVTWSSIRPVDKTDTETWHFIRPVGINVLEEEDFRSAIAFFEDAFPKILEGIYQKEGVAIPSVRFEIEPPLLFKEDNAVTFDHIGGLSDVVTMLKGIARIEQQNLLLGQDGRFPLLVGPLGTGKTSLATATAHEMGIPLVPKTALDLQGMKEGNIAGLFQSWHLEAKAAARRSGGKAMLFIESLDAFPGDKTTNEMLANLVTEWQRDKEVFVVVSTNDIKALGGGVVDRFRIIPVPLPNGDGIRQIIDIHVARIARVFGRNIFASVDLDRLAARIKTYTGINGRGIVKFLSGVYTVSFMEGEEITTEYILKNLPAQGFGFQPSN